VTTAPLSVLITSRGVPFGANKAIQTEAFTAKLMGVPAIDAAPDVAEGVSQFGTPEIEKLTLPLDALSV
jgi:hypothetical protein